MKITGIDLFPIRMDPVKTGYRREDELSKIARVDTILIRINTDTDIYGLGEAATIRSYFNQTGSTMMEWLEGSAEALVGADPLNFHDVHRRIHPVSGEKPPGTHPARAAVDMALHDLAGRAHGVPVYTLLGGAYRTEFEMLTNLYEETAEEKVAAALEFVAKGFKGLKVKVGDSFILNGYSMANVQHELGMLQAVLEAVPSDIYVDADSNQSWQTAKFAVRAVAMLTQDRFYPNLSIEQPLHHRDFQGHGYVRDAIPVPLILDETIVSPEAMLQVVKHDACDRIVLKMNRVGGYRSAMRVAAICEAEGIGISLDTMPFTKLGDTAHCHLAAAFRDPYPIDAEGHLWFRDTPITGGVELDGGTARISDAPGLGVELDMVKLEAMAL